MIRILCGVVGEGLCDPTLNSMEMINELPQISGEIVMCVPHQLKHIVFVHVVVSLFTSNISITYMVSFFSAAVNYETRKHLNRQTGG